MRELFPADAADGGKAPAGRLRVAMFTPVRPQRSGIADYSEELLPFLCRHADVCVVVGPECMADAVAIPGVPLVSLDDFLRDPSAFGLPVYQVGNSVEHHGYMIPALWQCPGVLVLHDCCLNHLVLGLTLARGDAPALRYLMQPAYGEQAAALGRKLLFGSIDPLNLSFAHALIGRSRAVLVHSQSARDFVRKSAPGKPVAVVPMGVPIDAAGSQEPGLRAKYGFAADDFLLASVTTPARNKRIELVVQAVAQLRQRYPALKLVILGSGPLGETGRSLQSDPALRQGITVTGWLDGDAYRDHIRMADAVVDMRYPSGGETSASLLRALAAGKALIVSQQGPFAELPGSCSVKIAVDAEEARNLTAAIAHLMSDAEHRARMGQAAREFASSQLGLDTAADGYARFLREVILSAPAAAPEPFPDPQRSAVSRLVVSTVYNVSRSIQFLRAYGWRDTLARIRRRSGTRPRPGDSSVDVSRSEAVAPR